MKCIRQYVSRLLQLLVGARMTQAQFVFDGGALPANAATIQKRAKVLNAALKKAKTFKVEFMKDG
jgi:hypothetical protein